MWKTICLFIGLITLSYQTIAQEDINITGRISDQKTYEPVPYVHIINKSQKSGAASDINGAFNIEAQVGDTIVFSAIGYSKQSIIITKDVAGASLDIKLSDESMELKTVNVFAYRDLSSLKRAIVEMAIPLEEKDELVIDLPPIDPVSFSESNGGMAGVALRGGLTALINGVGLNKEYNERKKFNELIALRDRKERAERKFNAELLKQWTDLKDEEIEKFMEFCDLSEDFILNSSEYDIIVSVNSCLDDFRNQLDN